MSAVKNETPLAELHRLFDYCPVTGVLIWKVKPCPRMPAGVVAGGPNTRGYWQVRVGERKLKVHRIIFAMWHGYWPSKNVDHINGVTSDNRIENLRDASQLQNNWNRRNQQNSTTGIKGVCRESGTEKWRARIHSKGARLYLGCFSNLEDAERAVRAKRVELHGVFANHG